MKLNSVTHKTMVVYHFILSLVIAFLLIFSCSQSSHQDHQNSHRCCSALSEKIVVVSEQPFPNTPSQTHQSTNNATGCQYTIDGEGSIELESKHSADRLLISTNATFSNCVFSPVTTSNHSMAMAMVVDFNTSVSIVYVTAPNITTKPHLTVAFFHCTFANFKEPAVSLVRKEQKNDTNDDYSNDSNDNNDNYDNNGIESSFGSLSVLFVGCEFDSNDISISAVNFVADYIAVNVSVLESTFRHNRQSAVFIRSFNVKLSTPSLSKHIFQFINNSFIDNHHHQEVYEYGYGAAIHGVSFNASLLISGCLFENNKANGAGAIEISQVSAPIHIASSVFRNNHVVKAGGGGAIFIDTVDTLLIADSLFDSNGAVCMDSIESHSEYVQQHCMGGALQVNQYRNLTILGSIFSNNTAASVGGAIMITRPMAPYADPATTLKITVISGCHFESNQARDGGAIYIIEIDNTIDRESALIEISSTTFQENFAKESGGSVYASTATATISNCTFDKSSSARAGGSLFIPPQGTVRLFDVAFLEGAVTVWYCETDCSGGAVFNAGVFECTRCTFSETFGLQLGNVIATSGKTTCDECAFINNINVIPSNRAAIVAWAGRVLISNSVFFNNTGTLETLDHPGSFGSTTLTVAFTNCTVEEVKSPLPTVSFLTSSSSFFFSSSNQVTNIPSKR